MTPQTTWSIYSSILRYFPRAKTVHLRGHHVNLANCPTPFLSLLSTCFDRVTIPVLDTRMSNTNSTPNTSGIDLSRFTVERAVVANVSNVRRIQDFSGLRVQGLDLASPFPAPGFQEAWSALSYPGLTTLSIFGTVEAASNSSRFYDFVSRHPELETVYIQTEENLEQSTFPLLRKLYQGFRAPSFVHVKYALFERVSNSSSTVSFDCPELSVRTIAGSLSSLADLIARVEICCPSVTDLTIEAMNLGPMDFEFEPVRRVYPLLMLRLIFVGLGFLQGYIFIANADLILGISRTLDPTFVSFRSLFLALHQELGLGAEGCCILQPSTCLSNSI